MRTEKQEEEFLNMFRHNDGEVAASEAGLKEALLYGGTTNCLVRGKPPAARGLIMVIHPALSRSLGRQMLNHGELLAKTLGRRIWWWKDYFSKWEVLAFYSPENDARTDWFGYFDPAGGWNLLGAS